MPRRPRHHQVGEQHADAVLAQRARARPLPSDADEHAQPFAPEDLLERLDDRGLVVDHEHDARVGRGLRAARLARRCHGAPLPPSTWAAANRRNGLCAGWFHMAPVSQ